MPIADILIRSICGYVFVIPGLLLYFGYLKKSGKGQSPCHIAAVWIFCYYLIGVLTMTGMGKLRPFAPRFVFIPFADMIRGPVDTILNVVLFLPFGFFIPLLYRKYHRIGRVAFTGFLLSLTIEFIQMFGRGATDVNDLITNTVGACLGYLIYKFLSKADRKGLCKKFQAASINEDAEVVLFTGYSFLIMLTIQPFVLHCLFRLG